MARITKIYISCITPCKQILIHHKKNGKKTETKELKVHLAQNKWYSSTLWSHDHSLIEDQEGWQQLKQSAGMDKYTWIGSCNINSIKGLNTLLHFFAVLVNRIDSHAATMSYTKLWENNSRFNRVLLYHSLWKTKLKRMVLRMRKCFLNTGKHNMKTMGGRF